MQSKTATAHAATAAVAAAAAATAATAAAAAATYINYVTGLDSPGGYAIGLMSRAGLSGCVYL